MNPLSLGAALKRGALVTAANWPVVLVDFTIESLYKTALAVPIVGGAVMVASVLGADLQSIVSGGVQDAADVIISSLAGAPAGMISFLLAVTAVGLGGACIMFAVKAGTLSILVDGERRAGDLHLLPVEVATARRAGAYRLDALIENTGRFARRACVLAAALGLAYLALGLGFFVLGRIGLGVAAEWSPGAIWPVVVLAATLLGVVCFALVNLSYDLLRLIMVTEDCELGAAARHLRRFVVTDVRKVMGVLAIMGGLVVVATLVSLLAAAGLTVAAWVPLVGVVIVPLQAAVWVMRGLVFQYLSLATITACQAQYRRFAGTSTPDAFPPQPQ